MRLVAVLLAIAVATAVHAEVPGASDPGFRTAEQVWLSGDEAAGLTALSVLAKGGNTAARLLLGQTDATPALQGPWLAGQTRAARIALLRAPGGLSGTGWMKALAGSDPLAAIWARLWRGDTEVSVVLEFARAGEPRLARLAAMTLARRQQHGFAEAATDPDYPAALRAFASREAEDLPPGDPQREVLGEAVLPANVADWALTAPEGDPLVALCEVACPEVAAACRAEAYTALGGYWRLMALGSPVEALIPSAEFNRSPMGMAVTARQLAEDKLTLACLKPLAQK